jgi:segregation and condensation protein B
MSVERFELLRRLEAILFASAAPLGDNVLLSRLPEGTELAPLLEELQGQYANRGVNLVQRGKGWAFRTAPDMAPFFTLEREVPRKLSRAAVETMAIIAYQQPVTRAEVEEIRGVALSKGTLDILLEAGWIKPKGRRRVPGRPVTWGTTESFLDFFGLEGLDALPGIDELKAAGLLDRRAGVGAIAMREDDLFQGDREDDAEDGDDMEDFLEATLDEEEESDDQPERADLSQSDG